MQSEVCDTAQGARRALLPHSLPDKEPGACPTQPWGSVWRVAPQSKGSICALLGGRGPYQGPSGEAVHGQVMSLGLYPFLPWQRGAELGSLASCSHSCLYRRPGDSSAALGPHLDVRFFAGERTYG